MSVYFAHHARSKATERLGELEILEPYTTIEEQRIEEGRCATLTQVAKDFEKAWSIKTNGALTVGRVHTCDITINHQFVSNYHFRIYTVFISHELDLLVYCEDQSSNGTFVNKVLIGKGRSLLLNDGDKIEIRHASTFIFNQTLRKQKNVKDILGEDKQFIDQHYNMTSRLLGSGGFGKLYMATSCSTGAQVACKIMKREKMIEKGAQYAQEVDILKKLSHANVIAVRTCFLTTSKVYLFEDLIPGGDLLSFFNRHNCYIPEVDTIFIVFQVLQALAYLHSHHVAHRDLKLENIMLLSDSPPAIVLTDFGGARKFDSLGRMNTVIGTMGYTAPEVFSNRVGGNGYGEEVDMWSLGVVIHILLSGIHPFGDSCDVESPAVVMERVSKGLLDLSASCWKDITNEGVIGCFAGSRLFRQRLRLLSNSN
ncbi:Meiosis-specific serine/threonine-protein kinase mek1 [Neolecta irregularis DAH-3]|uniref:Meiosis-specific serine/threonine-protein kinase mek1 n=1 Tax=Neolecta irregularis (strain DAH-3) TaxID=1198029 RepID=A0A1U7LWR7_NEOID|nr:Meiosis-specific serine/threonine-protein kinase mek1 [Neolecta irregularis DAH-3]|eukprot:OLL26992.1 Meiosis-specific serine/threonine-protein kinase mek1 [Neolecta irregularis DAH-3]